MKNKHPLLPMALVFCLPLLLVVPTGPTAKERATADEESSRGAHARTSLASQDRAGQYAAVKCLLEEQDYQAAARALEQLELHWPEEEGCFDIFFLWGKAQRGLDDLQASTTYFNRAIQCAESSPKLVAPSQLIEAHHLAGMNCYAKEDYLLAIEYFTMAVGLIQKHELKLQGIEVALRQSLGHCYGFLGRYKQAQHHYERALGLAYDYRDYTAHQAARLQVYRSLGQLRQRLQQYPQAHFALRKSIRLSTQLYGEQGLETAKGYDALSSLSFQEGRYGEALEQARKALEGYAAAHGAQSPLAACQLAQIGACLAGLGQYGSAAQIAEQALAAIGFDPHRRHPFEGYETQQRPLLDVLYRTALIHQKAYEAGQGMAHLERAGLFFGLSVDLVEYLNERLEDSGTKPYLLHEYYFVFEGALRNGYERYQQSESWGDLEAALAYAERSKAILLKEAVQKAGAETKEVIPPALLAQYRQLKQTVIQLENQRYERSLEAAAAEDIHELSSQIFQARMAYYRLEDSLSSNYPEYYRLKTSPPPLSLAEIQLGLLSPDQALVQYFVGQEHIYAFTITPEQAHLSRFANDSTLENAVLSLRDDIYGWLLNKTEDRLASYHARAYSLYERLIAPIEHLLPERLIIIPDGVLEYLPFDALLSQAPQPALALPSYPYLLHRHQLSYAHSARLLTEMKDRSGLPRQRRKALAFAPRFELEKTANLPPSQRRSSLVPLYSNEEEVQHIKKTLRTRVRKGKRATRERFLEEAHQYSILHLATHAKANDYEGDYSYLAFSHNPAAKNKPLLYAKDLYALRLPAEMAVLSACETGLGELRRGEGAISLARGFAHAGTRSLVATLWRVSDKETADFMRLFYSNLQLKMPKDSALCLAKRAYLKQAPPDKAHPFFWAAFTLSGDMSPIVTPSAHPPWLLYAFGIAAGLLMGAGWWLYRKSRLRFGYNFQKPTRNNVFFS
jgi:CHAT domain-containing protein